MEISELTLKLIILLIPGVIASIIFERLTIHKKWNSFKFVANSVLLGGVSYLFAQLTINIFSDDESFTNFWLNLPTKDIPYSPIIKATVCSVLVGFICAGLDNYKIINRIAKCLKLTTKYGDENLFSYFLNAKNVEEIYIRDILNNITYHGMIESFSETDEIKEIVLRDVKVYDYTTAKKAYELDKIYLSKPKDNLIIEIPFIKNEKANNNAGKSQV